MSQLHVFIDGSWLYKAASPDLVLASKTEHPGQGVLLDFAKLDAVLLSYVHKCDAKCSELGDRFLSTSIFSLPADFDTWPSKHPHITSANIEQTKRSLYARERFAESAIKAGYSDKGIYRPMIKDWMIQKLMDRRYQEKQVDTTVVALLVRNAIIKGSDYHCVITGDADILPAIRVAYPEYSKNVFVATTHPDELLTQHRQTSFSIHNFKFEIEPLYLQDHVAEIIHGTHVYTCAHCHKVFTRTVAIPPRARPCCAICHAKRT